MTNEEIKELATREVAKFLVIRPDLLLANPSVDVYTAQDMRNLRWRLCVEVHLPAKNRTVSVGVKFREHAAELMCEEQGRAMMIELRTRLGDAFNAECAMHALELKELHGLELNDLHGLD